MSNAKTAQINPKIFNGAKAHKYVIEKTVNINVLFNNFDSFILASK